MKKQENLDLGVLKYETKMFFVFSQPDWANVMELFAEE
jgi:hypothetical protein